MSRKSTLDPTATPVKNKLNSCRKECQKVLTMLKMMANHNKRQLSIEWFELKRLKTQLPGLLGDWMGTIIFYDQSQAKASQGALASDDKYTLIRVHHL